VVHFLNRLLFWQSKNSFVLAVWLFACLHISAVCKTSRVRAYVVADVNTGKILAQKNANTQCPPASLTKKMTLYLLFSAIKEGRITFDTKFKVSVRAANQMASKLNLQAGSVVSVKTIIEALIVKSANDAAVVAAEGLSGSVEAFVVLMNKKAKSLGMHYTHFANPSGVPDARQKTTARDMAILARALFHDFPDFTAFFKVRSFLYKKNRYFTHNKILDKFQGSNGLKTGYVDASGYNLSTSAVRYDASGKSYHILAVVIGHDSTEARDKEAIDLLERFFIANGALFYDAASVTLHCKDGLPISGKRGVKMKKDKQKKVIRAPIRTKGGMDLLLKGFLQEKIRAVTPSRRKNYSGALS
jgi:D-alanyl-D-alanine carboxypeptidase